MPRNSLSEQGREKTSNATHIHGFDGFRPGPYCWEASALTTAQFLQLQFTIYKF